MSVTLRAVSATERESTAVPAHSLLIQLARAEGRVLALEGTLAHFDALIKSLGSSLAAIRAFAYEQVLVAVPAMTQPLLIAAPLIDEITRAKARRVLARSGFVTVKP